MDIKKYTIGEEIANSITHGLGALFSAFGLIYLLINSIQDGTIWHIVSFSIFGFSLILLYSASTLYHSIQKVNYKKLLRKFDHSAIFLLIAGSYTPFLLVSLRGVWGWSLFVIVWTLAITGIILKFKFISRFQKLSVGIYVFMGWLVVVAANEIALKLDNETIIYLFAGGLFYTLGVGFYIWKKLPYNHAIWHLFVLGGSISHYLAVASIL